MKASFNQQIAQYRGKVPDQQLMDLAVGQFEEQLAKTQEQVGFTCNRVMPVVVVACIDSCCFDGYTELSLELRPHGEGCQ